ncbi:MAG: dihydropteroate synthase [Myxococcota bacterium]
MSAILQTARVVGVLNATPDSFSDGGRFVDGGGLHLGPALELAAGQVEAGVDLLDVGGESTRPGAREVSVDEECARTVPLIEALAKRFATPISVDTRKSEVADAALAAGAEVVNDVSGLRFEPALAEVVSRHGAGLVLGHARGTPETMQDDPHYDRVIEEVAGELRESVAWARDAGLPDAALAVDPGIGFGKRPEDNHALLTRIGALRGAVGGSFPVWVGPSRKAFLGALTGDPAPERDAATHAACAIAVYEGADTVRVHDVAGAVRVVAVARALRAARDADAGRTPA